MWVLEWGQVASCLHSTWYRAWSRKQCCGKAASFHPSWFCKMTEQASALCRLLVTYVYVTWFSAFVKLRGRSWCIGNPDAVLMSTHPHPWGVVSSLLSSILPATAPPSSDPPWSPWSFCQSSPFPSRAMGLTQVCVPSTPCPWSADFVGGADVHPEVATLALVSQTRMPTSSTGKAWAAADGRRRAWEKRRVALSSAKCHCGGGWWGLLFRYLEF